LSGDGDLKESKNGFLVTQLQTQLLESTATIAISS